ncbi:error-prone DNA polymerase [Lichenifustis flavocetrariae]|uniref:Error-prone DNA polymerase n=1 Tax=Lichenifustis flavocetrariae TaxID=2949735 RepID=A0AA41YX76_9HYPH|nr:error-prone DNA polymerase [Lichenifustis flavocetrariae]MCW6508906.1 error-prone DNA polymerase [Lichenifustis flavocetrariae]
MFVEFGTTTNFSFLRGASHPEELVAMASGFALPALGIADRNSLAGVVRAYIQARKPMDHPVRLVAGARLVFADGTPDILAYPVDRDAYGRLTRLLTIGNRRAEKGACVLTLADLLDWIEGLQLIVMDRSSATDEETVLHPAPPVGEEGNRDRTGSPKDSPSPANGRKWPLRQQGSDEGKLSDPDPPHPIRLCRATFSRGTGEGKHWASLHFTPPLPPANDNPPPQPDQASLLRRLACAAPGRVWIAATMTYGPAMRAGLAARRALARATGLPLLATNDVLMHAPERRQLADVLVCIRTGIPIDRAGRRLEANAERHLKSGPEMARLFTEAPEAVPETLRFLEGIRFSLDELKYNYPDELRAGYDTEQEALRAFAEAGTRWRYPTGVPDEVQRQLNHELALVAELDYAAYFLTVYDVVQFARREGILCQGRGSAANSTLCYCLGITEIDPVHHAMLFERFISKNRNEPPDIDVDFEHERREAVMQYIYEHYGRAHAGLVATVITYRTRSALRDVGKAFGLSDDTVSALSGTVWGYWSSGIDPKEARRIGLDPDEHRLKLMLTLADELAGFPRHLSQHTGGFVITRTRLDEVVPISNAAMDDRTVVEWDKDDLDALGMIKIDVLALGMLTCLKKGFDLLEQHYGQTLTLDDVLKRDQVESCVYDMICRADTIGVFQIESRAQMTMLPRLKPREFYDLVIEVAIVRPGPIQGDMVHPYLRRRQGLEPVIYPSDELREVLQRTLGVPLFQEHAMKIAIVAAGFTPDEADQLRRAMATFKKVGTIGTFRDKMVNGMVAKGYPADFAERCFKQIEGFGTYGFPESHAASFALLVYTSAWLKCRYPDVFACALLNAQPMGFYAPAQIIRDARDHGVPVQPVDINASTWDHSLEDPFSQANGRRRHGEAETDEGTPGAAFPLTRPHFERPPSPAHAGEGKACLHPRHATMRDDILGDKALRLGFRQVKGLGQADMDRLVARRGQGYDSIRDLWLRAELTLATLEDLAEADAFRSIGLDRRDALWAVRGLNRAGDKDDLPLFASASSVPHEPDAALPPMALGEHVVEDYRHISLSLKAHPVRFVRSELAARRIVPNVELGPARNGRRVTVAGLVLVRQRPGSASGTIFLTIEDETGVANIIVWPKVFEVNRAAVIAARFLAVTGLLQHESGVTHVVAERFEDLTAMLTQLSRRGAEIEDLARADEVKRPQTFEGKKRGLGAELAAKIGFPLATDTRRPKSAPETGPHLHDALPKGRNFH